MGRYARKLLARVLAIGIITCCCLTFITRINMSVPPQEDQVFSNRRMPKETMGKSKELSFAQAAREMKAFAESKLQDGREGQAVPRNDIEKNVLDTDHDKLPELCSQKEKRPNYLHAKASIIISLIRLGDDDPVTLLYNVLYRIPDHVTDDVIITVEDSMLDFKKQRLEEAVDFCGHCRLFFLDGTIYEHRNAATKFSREPNLIFVDARITPSDGWIEPLLFELNFNPWSVVSPHMHLRNKAKSISDVGLSRLELTWDLNVIRAPLTEVQKGLVQNGQVTSVNQTAVLKEVIAIKKDFFTQLGFFDIIPGASGGEHVSFSLKVINCGGEIFMPICSRVFLDAPNRNTSLYLDPLSPERFFIRDYPSPSFRVPKFNLSAYFDANSKLWLDSFSSTFYGSSAHRQVIGSGLSKKRTVTNSRNSYLYAKYGRHANRLKVTLMSMECELTNFRYVVMKYQPSFSSPTKRASHFGYIRSLDAMFAFGLMPDSPFFSSSSSSGAASKGQGHIAGKARNSNQHSDKKNRQKYTDDNWLIYTRNSSLWVGPFSYNQGTLQYKRIWCVTATEQGIALDLCQRQDTRQTFLFIDGVFRLANGGGKSCIKLESPSESSSQPVSFRPILLPCGVQQSSAVDVYFSMDMEFVQ